MPNVRLYIEGSRPPSRTWLVWVVIATEATSRLARAVGLGRGLHPIMESRQAMPRGDAVTLPPSFYCIGVAEGRSGCARLGCWEQVGCLGVLGAGPVPIIGHLELSLTNLPQPLEGWADASCHLIACWRCREPAGTNQQDIWKHREMFCCPISFI